MKVPQAEIDWGAQEVMPGSIRWGHATNTTERLGAMLSSPTVDFIEVDLSLGGSGEVIAAHPPVTESDLTIAGLLKEVRKSNKGVKFDFKDPKTVVPVLEELAAAPLEQPVILNADVLRIASGGKIIIDGEWFIEKCQSMYADGLLSLGWRTSARPRNTYSLNDVTDMLKLTDGLPEVTFPVRASMVRGSWDNLQHLLDAPGKRTLTIWSNRLVNPIDRIWMKRFAKPTFCYYDLPRRHT